MPEEERRISHEGETEARVEALVELVHQLVELGDRSALQRVLNKERPADVADVIRRLEDVLREQVFNLLEEHLAAEVLAESDTTTALAIVEDLDNQEISHLVEEMEPDDAADVLGELEDKQAEAVLDLMEEGARKVQELLAHEEDTGGGLMTPKLVLAHRTSSVSGVIQTLVKTHLRRCFFAYA